MDEGKTILMVTHDRDLASRVPRVLRIADGAIVQDRIQKTPGWEVPHAGIVSKN